MTRQYLALVEVLIGIEKELRELQLWDAEVPSEEALSSTQPFAIDTLTFAQWLQFIFIPRLYLMIEHRAELPHNCGVAPMAEQYFQPQLLNSAPLIEHLRQVDNLLTR